MMETAEPVAMLHDITHYYGKKAALKGVSLVLGAGELVGLIGPDGVGKSTLLALLAGATKLQSGRARVFGGDFTQARHRATVCARIAYMPQGLGRNLYLEISTLRQPVCDKCR